MQIIVELKVTINNFKLDMLLFTLHWAVRGKTCNKKS